MRLLIPSGDTWIKKEEVQAWIRTSSFYFILLSCFVAILMCCCSPKTGTMAQRPIEQVLKEHTDQLMSLPGVVGTAQGLCGNQACIKVYVVQLTPELEKEIPKKLEGYKVDVEETGEIKAFPGQ